MQPQVISGISPRFRGLSPSTGQVTHVLLTRSPLEHPPKEAFPLDLHVLSTPPAFVLSQDQTLQQKPKEKNPSRKILPKPQPHKRARKQTIGTGISSTLLSSQRTTTHRNRSPDQAARLRGTRSTLLRRPGRVNRYLPVTTSLTQYARLPLRAASLRAVRSKGSAGRPLRSRRSRARFPAGRQPYPVLPRPPNRHRDRRGTPAQASDRRASPMPRWNVG